MSLSVFVNKIRRTLGRVGKEMKIKKDIGVRLKLPGAKPLALWVNVLP